MRLIPVSTTSLPTLPDASSAAPCPRPARKGRLYRLDTDGNLTIVAEEVGTSNGMGFTLDRRQMYYTDTHAQEIYLYDYAQETGAISNRRVFVHVPDGDGGRPDGMTVDAEGFVWSARWDGGCLVRYDPTGKEERRIAFPAKKITSLIFGGPDYTDMYVTGAVRQQQDRKRRRRRGAISPKFRRSRAARVSRQMYAYVDAITTPTQYNKENIMQVQSKMSSPVVSVEPDTSFNSALSLMEEQGIHHLPVVNSQGQLVGILAERDILLAASHYMHGDTDVEDIMLKGVVTVGPEFLLTDVAELMIDRHIGALPVVDANQQLLGIITETDILKTFVELVGKGRSSR